MSNEKTAAKAPAKTSPWYWFHVAVGLLIMIGFPQLGPFEPITETGMWVAGIFIGMVYLWSALDSIWPSLLGYCCWPFTPVIWGMSQATLLSKLFL